MAKSWIKNLFRKFSSHKKRQQKIKPSLSLEPLESRLNPRTFIRGTTTLVIECSDLPDVLVVSMQGTSITLTDNSATPVPGNAITGTFNGTTATGNTVTLNLPPNFTGIDIFMNGSPDTLIINNGLDFSTLPAATFKGDMHIWLNGNAPLDDDVLVLNGNNGAELTVSSNRDYCKIENFAFIVNSDSNVKAANINSLTQTSNQQEFLFVLNQEHNNSANSILTPSVSGPNLIPNNIPYASYPDEFKQNAFISVGNYSYNSLYTNYTRNSNAPLQPPANNGDIRFQAVGSNNQIQIDSEIQLWNGTNEVLFGYPTGKDQPVAINSQSTLGNYSRQPLFYSISSTLANTPNVTLQTQGTVILQGSIDIRGKLDILDTGDFNIGIADNNNFFIDSINIINNTSTLGGERNFKAASITIASNDIINPLIVFDVSGSVETYTSSLVISPLGGTVPGSRVEFCTDAPFSSNNTFIVAGNFTVQSNKSDTSIFNLSIFANNVDPSINSGRSAVVGSSGTGNATLWNRGNLTIGNVDNPVAGPNQSFIVNGFFNALKEPLNTSGIYADSFFFADIICEQSFQINSRVITVRGQSTGTETDKKRTFTIQAKRGDLNINSGDIVLEDSPTSTTVFPDGPAGSDLHLQAGVGTSDTGKVNIQSIYGPNRTFRIVDCQDFNANGSLSVRRLELQSDGKGGGGGDSNNGAGTYIFNGGIGLLNSPTQFFAEEGKYNIQFFGSNNYLAPLYKSVTQLFEGSINFNNTGRNTFGDNAFDVVTLVSDPRSASTVGFGNAIFGQGTILSGTGMIFGNATAYGAVMPGNFFFTDTSGNTVAQDGGVLKINGNMVIQEKTPSANPDANAAVFYADLFGTNPGKFLDQLSVSGNLTLQQTPILYPVLRTVESQYSIGTKFTIVSITGNNGTGGLYSGLINPSTNTYAVLNEGDSFYAGGVKYSISYTGGDGNDTVITLLEKPFTSYVFVDVNNVLNIYGNNNSSNITSEIPLQNGVRTPVLLNVGQGYNSSPIITFSGQPTVSPTAIATLGVGSLAGTISTAAIATKSFNNQQYIDGGKNYAVGDIVQIMGTSEPGNAAYAVVTNITNQFNPVTSTNDTGVITNLRFNLSSLNTVSVTNGGTGYGALQSIPVTLTGSGVAIPAIGTAFTNASGAITYIAINSGGLGYVSGATYSVNAPGTGGTGALVTPDLLTTNSNYGYDISNSSGLVIQPISSLGSGGTVNATIGFSNLQNGSGYYVGQEVALQEGNGAGANKSATATVTAIDSLGNITGMNITNNGQGYTNLKNLEVTGSTTGNNAKIDAFGFVSTITLTDKGAGYLLNPTVTINSTNGFGSQATAKVQLEERLNISDLLYGLNGFAYGAKVQNNAISINLADPAVIGPGQFTGYKIQQLGGNDTLNIINNDFIKAQDYNSNIQNVYFSFNGGPTNTPNIDTDTLNIIGLNQNVETGSTGISTITISGYDNLRSKSVVDGSKQSGQLFSANQYNQAFNISGNIYFDYGTQINLGTNARSSFVNQSDYPLDYKLLVPNTSGILTFQNDVFLGDDFNLTIGKNIPALGGAVTVGAGNVDLVNDSITVLSNSPYYNGMKVSISPSSGGTLPSGLNSQTYYIIRNSPSSIQFALNPNNAANGTAVNLTSVGVDNILITSTDSVTFPSNVVMNNVYGTTGLGGGDLAFQLNSSLAINNGIYVGSVQIGPITQNVPIDLKVPVYGGNITVNGIVGNNMDLIQIKDSGLVDFRSSVDSVNLEINKNVYGVTFRGVVGANVAPSIVIDNISKGAFVRFQNNLSAKSIITGVNEYALEFLGFQTKVTLYASLMNTGGIILGDSNDTVSFLEGLEIPTSSSVEMYGTVQTPGRTIRILSDSITLHGNSQIKTTFGVGNSSPITLGTVNSQGFKISLDAGDGSGSVIIVDNLFGAKGNLEIINSDGVSINQVGKFDPNNEVYETFGTITITDSANEVAFNGTFIAERLITNDQYYDVAFRGLSQIGNSTSSHITFADNSAADEYKDRWLFAVTGTQPTIFNNKGSVTLGLNGANPAELEDILIFNGGLDTSRISGYSNLAGRIYTNNTDINLANINIKNQTFLNTYLSSQAFYEYDTQYNQYRLQNNLDPLPGALRILDYPTYLNPQIQNRPNQVIPIDYQILKLFGYPYYFNASASTNNQPTNLPVLPLGSLPSKTGNINLGPISNYNNKLEINAGGLGIYGGVVAGDVTIASYAGTGNESVGLYRANNVSFTGNTSGTNFLFGVKANTGISHGIELINTVTVQGNFAVNNLLSVSNDVNNLSFSGSLNNFISENIIANSGFVQFGNDETDITNVTNNLNIRGAAVRRLAGTFNMAQGKNLDSGPGPVSLVGNTVINTSGDGRTTIGQITNNQFNITFNGTVELQRYTDDSLISPYPVNNNPPSYIPTNDIVGAGTGGGNTYFKGLVTIQEVKKNSLDVINVITTGFVNQYPWTGYDKAPEISITDGGGLGASAISFLGLVSIPGTNSKISFLDENGTAVTPATPLSYGMRVLSGSPGVNYNDNEIVEIIQVNQGSLPGNLSPISTLVAARGQVTIYRDPTNPTATSGPIQYITLLSPNNPINGVTTYGTYTNFMSDGLGTTGDLLIRNTSNTNGSAYIINTPYDDIIGGVIKIDYTNRGAGYTTVPNVEVLGNTVTGAPAYRSTVPPLTFASTSLTTSTGFAIGNYINVPSNVNLKKQGTGNLYLYTDNSLTTNNLLATVEKGGVYFEGAKISSATTTSVLNKGSVGGTSGYLGTLNVLTGGTLSPGTFTTSTTQGTIGKLNITGDLVIQGNYDVDIRSQAFNLFDQVVVNGKVQISKSGLNGLLNVKFTEEANVQVGQMFGIIKNDGSSNVNGIFTTIDSVSGTTIVLTEGSTFKRVLPNGEEVTFQITYQGNVTANSTSFTGGNDIVLQVVSRVTPQVAVTQRKQFPLKLYSVSTDAGGGPVVRINFADGSGFSFFAYAPTFTGGVRTAIGDINGDGQPDLVTAAGPGGGPHVVVWSINPSLSYATVQSSFFAFEPTFTGGLTLSTGNLNGDVSSSGYGFDDIIVGAGAGGGPRVAAFAGNANYASNPTTRIADFFAYDPSFNKGVNVAAGDVATGQFDEIITGAGQGGAPHVAVWQNSAAQPTVWNKVNEFFAFSPTLICGVFVGAGDLDSDGRADIYTGTGSGTTGTAGVFFGNGAVTKFEPFGQFFYGGVRVGAAIGPANANGTTPANQNFLIAAAGPGGGPQVSIFNGNLNLVDAFFAFPQNFTGGVLASTTVNR